MVDVPEVEFDPFDHLLEPACFAPQSVDLRPTGHPRFDMVAEGIFRDQSLVLIVMRKRMRSRADQGHVALHNIEELRELINARRAQYLPDSGNPAVAALRLANRRSVLHDRHGSKFEDHELMSVEAISALAEYDRATTIQFDRDSCGD